MQKLPASLGLPAAISIVVGSLIGSGIFMKPATMAGQLGSPELLIAVWVGAGIITLFGALSNAEVAAMLPETGGQYVFFEKMYGHFFAWLYGWSAFAVFNTAGVASIAYVFGTYVEYFIQLPRFPAEVEQSIDLHIPFIGHIYPLANFGVKSITILVVLSLTYINYRSTSFGGSLLTLFTMLKVIAILLVVVTLFSSSSGEAQHFLSDASSVSLSGMAMVGAVVAALSGAFWAYDGWNNVSFVGGEIKNPRQNIPRSLLIGTLTCMTLYVLINMAYLYVMPIGEMASSTMVASDAMQVVLGAVGGGVIALLIVLSTFSAAQGNMLAVTRVTFTMAAENRFFPSIGRVHPRFQTPGNALWLHGIWTSLLVISGSFDILTDMVIFSSWFFYGMSALGIFVLRKKMPATPRPYKVWGYPVVPAVYVVFTFFFLLLTIVHDISNYLAGRTHIIHSLFAILMTILGIPLYFYFRKKHHPVL